MWERVTLRKGIYDNRMVQYQITKLALDLWHETKDEAEALVIWQALRGCLRMWSPQNYYPISYEEARERFNRLVDFHWERLVAERPWMFYR